MPATGSPTRNSPTGSGKGTGSGATREEATQQEALLAALRSACSKLNLSSDLRRTCEAGQDFSVAVTSGGITVASLVERSQRCSGFNLNGLSGTRSGSDFRITAVP